MKGFRSLILTLIIILSIFLRFYQLGGVPSGLTNDEADIGYDAYSILLTGRDQWNIFLPITGFKGFGDNRPVLYTYLTIPSITYFGVTPFAVRFPSALFGVLSVVAAYFLAKKLAGKEIGLATAFIFSISPWAIGMSRIGVESNVAVFFLLVGLLFLIYSKKSFFYVFAGLFCLAVTLYLYTAYALFVPFLLLGLIFYSRKNLLKNKKLLISYFLFFLLLLSPYLLSMKNTGVFSRASTEGILVNTDSLGIIQNINAKRGSCLTSLNPTICRLLANKPLEFTGVFAKNFVNHFSFDYLYLNGSDVLRTILPEMGHEHLIELLFFIAGAYFLLISNLKFKGLLFSLPFLSVVPDSLTGTGNFSRSSMMLPFLMFIESIGFVYVGNYLIKKHSVNKNVSWTMLSSTIIVITLIFLINYLTYYRIEHSMKYTYKQLSKNLVNEKNNYEKIYVSEYLADAELHVFYLFYTRYDPALYQKKTTVSYSYKNNWISVDRLENIYFVDKLPINHKGKVLFIAKPEIFPENTPVKKEIKDLSGDTVFVEVDSLDFDKFINESCHDDENCAINSGWFE